MRRVLLPAAGFTGLAVLITWPLATVLATHVPGGGPDDNVNFLWNFWWMRDALTAWPSNPFRTDLLFHPFGVDLVLHTHTALAAFVGATLLGGVSIVTAQNLVLIGSAALNGFCAYLLALRVTGRIGPAAVGGVYFAASPYFAGHLLGHFNLYGAWGLPLFALVMSAAFDRGRRGFAAAAGVVLAAVAYSDYYYVVYLAALMALLLACRWLDAAFWRAPRRPIGAIDIALVAGAALAVALAVWIAATGGGVVNVAGLDVSMRSGHNVRVAAWVFAIAFVLRRVRPRASVRVAASATPGRELRLAAIAVGTTAVLTAPLWMAAFRLWLAGDYVAPARLWRSSTEGIDLASLVTGNPFHPLWRSTGEWIYATLQMSTIESTAWLGIVPVVVLWRARRHLGQPPMRFWAIVAGVFFVWALGPYLRVAGVNTGLWLPETLLHFVPVVSNARIPGRAIVMVYLAVGILLAAVLASSRSRRAGTIAALVGVAVVLDFLPAPIPLYRLEPPGVFQQLASLPDGAVLDLPLGVGDGLGERGALDNATLVHQATHHKPLVGGFVGRLPRRLAASYGDTPALVAILALSEGRSLPAAELAQAVEATRAFLAAHDIRYVVLDRPRASDALVAFAASLPLRLVGGDGRRQLYIITVKSPS
jgi:hypothetical protein